jgi:cyanophycinase
LPGYILLEGGAEFGGRMAEPDMRAIELAGGRDTPLSIIPAAAAPDDNHHRAGNHGVNWFKTLGSQHPQSLPLIDSSSANDPKLADVFATSKLIYLLGGFTHYLGQTLANSLCWDACLSAYNEGAVIAGSSAGAMVLCDHYYDPYTGRIFDGLGLVPGSCVLPHYNTFGKSWVAKLSRHLPDAILIGIDERTGMLDEVDSDGKRAWKIYGGGNVTIHHKGQTQVYQKDAVFHLPID